MENKIAHLNMIQGVINRMASNSFALKGWTVTLIAAILALAAKDTDKRYFLIAYVPILVFWWLDSFYLLQERLYRSLYKKVIQVKNDNDVDFSLSATQAEFDSKANCFCTCLFSKTEAGFYLPLAFVCTAVILITQWPL